MTTALDGSLSRLRRRSERLMPHSAAISRPALSSDGAGGRLTNYATVSTATACRVTVLSLSDVQRLVGSQALGREENRLDTSKAVKLTFPAGTDLARNDRAVVGTRTFQIMDMNSETTFQVHLEALALEV